MTTPTSRCAPKRSSRSWSRLTSGDDRRRLAPWPTAPRGGSDRSAPPPRGANDATRLAREDRDRTNALLASIDPSAFETGGLGGGTWSPKDLVGHLETWEENALEALDAWDRGERAPVAAKLQALGTDGFNAREVERKAATPSDTVRTSAAATHARMLERFAAIDEDRWSSAP